MRLITQRGLIQEVVKRWEQQYPERTGEKAEIRKKLKALNLKTATAEAIEKIIGNHSWTTIICDECGRDTDQAVEVGQEPDYESATAILCTDCASQAYILATTERGKK